MKCLGSTAESFRAIAIGMVLAILTGSMLAQEQASPRNGATPPHYVVVDLGTLGGSFSLAYGINDRGQINGTSTLPGDAVQHAFLFKNGKMSDVGTLGGPNSESFSNVNNRTQDSGTAETGVADPNNENFCSFGTDPSLICLGFVWQNGIMTALPALGGNNGQAAAINDLGIVAGYAELGATDPNCPPPQVLQFRPVVWRNGSPLPLSLYGSDSEGAAFWINDTGDVVGASGICAPYDPRYALEIQPRHALLWHNGAPIDLGNLGGSMQNAALAINDHRQIVGASDITGDTYQHAFLWQNGKMSDLGTLQGDVISAAVAINNRGQVTGVSSDANNNIRGFLWQSGTMYDLNDLVVGSSPLYLLHGFGINDAGWLVGLAFNSDVNEVHGFLAIPIPSSVQGDAQQDHYANKFSLADFSRQHIRQKVYTRYFGEAPPDPCKTVCKR